MNDTPGPPECGHSDGQAQTASLAAGELREGDPVFPGSCVVGDPIGARIEAGLAEPDEDATQLYEELRGATAS